ncbi:MAG: glycoside hydrolase family 127 protein [Bacteroidota bacterium]|nr:glycoside hydrolase family 127 protein [Bacteroidota bacterium]
MLERIFTQIRYRFFDYSGKPKNTKTHATDHLADALNWFQASLLPEGGGAAKYSMMTHNMSHGYPLSTANWVPVLSRIKSYYPEVYNRIFTNPDTIRELANWVLRTQRRDGTFPASYGDFMNQPPRVFNNGSIIHSLLDHHNDLGGNDLLEACIKSAEWLLKVQSADGSWRQFTFHQLSSNTITAAALIRLAGITGDKKYLEAGEKNIEFALDLQSENGYFKGNGFDSTGSAFTITIGYAIAGILDAGILTGNEKWKNAAKKGLIPVLNNVGPHGFLVGELDENFNSNASFSCLPGSCLLALTTYKLASLEANAGLKAKADLITDYVKGRQMESKMPLIHGGISGSWPISGNYCSYEITSWGVRYFVEALMMQDSMR